MNRNTSFPPASGPDAEILVLGSMPGRLSLEKSQYYAHPRNLFWRIMQLVLAVDSEAPYQQRIKALNARRIALWDVLKHCEREGSLDSNIRHHSEVANDIPGFLAAHSRIRRICFNGQKAYQSFRKHILKQYPAIIDHYELIVLPSTSPANASIPEAMKIDQWKRALIPDWEQ